MIPSDLETARPGALVPVECELCECRAHRWNGVSRALKTDPEPACECGHLTARHRYRRAEAES